MVAYLKEILTGKVKPLNLTHCELRVNIKDRHYQITQEDDRLVVRKVTDVLNPGMAIYPVVSNTIELK
jgi:hypothetical protein